MRRRFPVSSAGISAAMSFVETEVTTAGLGTGISHRLAIIVDEVCSNMLRHDTTLGAESTFEIEILPGDGQAAMIVRDPGAAFNPLIHTHDDQPRLGGHGIELVRGLAARVEYARNGTVNELSVVVADER